MEKFYLVSNNVTLRTELYIPKNRKQYPLVIFMHGLIANCHMEIFNVLVEKLNNIGIAVLRFDFNGHGESGGELENITFENELHDAMVVLKYAKSIREVTSISLLGHSQGGVIASILAGMEADGIKTLVLLAPAAVIEEGACSGKLLGQTFDPDNLPDYIRIMGKRFKGEFIKSAQSLKIYDKAKGYKGTVCILHGGGDYLINYKYSKKYHEIYNDSCLYFIEEADHDFSIGQEKAVNVIVDFFEDRLIKDCNYKNESQLKI